jgi:hypothetical protein
MASVGFEDVVLHVTEDVQPLVVQLGPCSVGEFSVAIEDDIDTVDPITLAFDEEGEADK